MNLTKQKIMITNTQLWTLLACIIWPTIIGYGGGILAREVGRDMLVSGVLAVLTTVAFAFVLIHTGRKFPGQTIVEYSQQLLGTFAGKFLGLGLVVYLMLAANQSINIYVHHINDFLLPETPFGVITVIHILVICYLVWHGPEVIARIAVIGFFQAGVFTLLVFLATLPEIDLHRVLPLFDTGLPIIGLAGLNAYSFTGPSLLIIAMLLPLVKDQKKAARSATTGLSIGGIIFLFFFLAELMVMGPHVTAQMRVACMDLVRAIQITEYLHRFESFMVALWYWSMLVQGGVFVYCATLAFRQIIGMQQQNVWVVITTGIILVVLTYLLGFNRVTFLNFLEHKWAYVSLPALFGVPLLLAFMGLFKKPAPGK